MKMIDTTILRITSNKSKKTFTIINKITQKKYRTFPQLTDDFQALEVADEAHWKMFIAGGDDYYEIKK